MEEEQGQWLECVVDNEYEIFSEYPHPIRRTGSDYIISEWVHRYGYVYCKMNGIQYRKHRIIAQQFIPNPNNLPEIDHINHNPIDNRIENLRWVSASENQKNKTSQHDIDYEYFDEIPCDSLHDVIEVRDYGKYEFEDLYYCDDFFYFFNGKHYRRLHINYLKTGQAYVRVNDINNQSRSIYYSKFKKLYNIQ